MEDKALGLIGLMRRAGAIELGEDNSADAVKAGKAKLLLMSADVSEAARRKALGYTASRSVHAVSVHYTREELGAALGVKSCAMAALTDMGFSNALMKELAKQYPEEYAALSQELEQRNDKAVRRRKETAARGGLKRNVKRRTEV